MVGEAGGAGADSSSASVAAAHAGAPGTTSTPTTSTAAGAPGDASADAVLQPGARIDVLFRLPDAAAATLRPQCRVIVYRPWRLMTVPHLLARPVLLCTAGLVQML